jgi:hypothetical protein
MHRQKLFRVIIVYNFFFTGTPLGKMVTLGGLMTPRLSRDRKVAGSISTSDGGILKFEFMIVLTLWFLDSENPHLLLSENGEKEKIPGEKCAC